MRHFFLDSTTRSGRCEEKDRIIRPLLDQAMQNADPETAHCLLMPCINGPEVAILKGHGVPAGNLMAIERDPDTLKVMASQEYLAGVWLPKKAETASRAIDRVWAELEERKAKLTLAYLDFFGPPNVVEHTELFSKMAKLDLLSDGAMVIATFGWTRCDTLTYQVNVAMSDGDIPIRPYVECMRVQYRIEDFETFQYESGVSGSYRRFLTSSMVVRRVKR